MEPVEIDAWLRDGGRVVASSDRAARAVLTAYHRARRAEGKAAWAAPAVQSWQAFAQEEWQRRATDGRLTLSALQEESLWAQVIQKSGQGAALLDGPLRRLAGLAMEAHELLCAYAPGYLEGKARRGWQQDAAAFHEWLRDFDAACRANDVVSTTRVAAELVLLLENDASARPPLLLVGFDRLTPVQRSVLEAWGEFHAEDAGEKAEDVSHFAATETAAELAACAAWCRQELEANAEARLLVITQDAKLRRGEIERAFLREASRSSAVRFEFSLGVPLATIAVVRSAFLLLRWLDAALEERELDWLFSTEYAGSSQESMALRAFHRTLRNKGRQRTQWALETWLRQSASPTSLPAAWSRRMQEAQRLLRANAKKNLSPLEWCALVPQLLDTMGWAGAQTLSSVEHQAVQRWERALESIGSLGYDGRRVAWQQFLAELGNVLQSTLFSPESEDTPILIAGPAESAGVTADAIWFLGADEATWPASGPLHPLIPADVQRAAKMPHALAQLDAELARGITMRLLHSAAKVRFSYARLKEDMEARASRLISQLAGEAQAMPAELAQRWDDLPRVERVVDAGSIPLRATAQESEVQGGSAILTAQSQCPFQAFATARLDARGWDEAEAGLSAAERGNLLHEVMHSAWGGARTGGMETLDELLALKDLEAFVAEHVSRVMREKVPARVREEAPQRYLQLEEMRLAKLVKEWLEFEATRLPFRVRETEVKKEADVAGLRLRLRLDRVDALNDGTLLVMDYKTGNVAPKAWELPRPEDVQLPLYAGFALPEGSELGGLTFARLRAGESGFAGCIGDARNTLLPNLSGSSALVKNALTAGKLLEWREAIEQLARDFLAGKADVNPRDFPKTCENCGLQSVCRVYEQDAALHDEEETAYDPG